MPEPYIPLSGHVKAVYIVFGIAALVYAISACSGLLEVQLMNKLIAGTQVSDAELTSNDSRPQLIAAIALWWLVWLSLSVTYVIARGHENAETPEEFRSGSITNVVADSLSIAGVLLAILVVRVASDRLDAKAAAVPPPALPAPEGDFSVPERPAGVPA